MCPGVFFAFVVGWRILPTMSVSRAPEYPDPVLLFDGDCGLCNRVVRGLLRADRSGRLRYGALQSAPAQAFLAKRGLPTQDLDSLIFVTDWAHRDEAPLLKRTAGATAALRVCGGFWRRLGEMIALVPGGWRDAVYRFVGHTRYRWFGPWQPRPLARADWAQRFVG
jgi:predicted DCC family thiol-disulfide oxidoreductase YuxK